MASPLLSTTPFTTSRRRICRSFFLSEIHNLRPVTRNHPMLVSALFLPEHFKRLAGVFNPFHPTHPLPKSPVKRRRTFFLFLQLKQRKRALAFAEFFAAVL